MMKLFVILVCLVTFTGMAFAEDDKQSPFSVSPAITAGWGYLSKTNYFSVDPGISLSTNFKTGTGKKISLDASGDFIFYEYVAEAEGEMRNYEWFLTLKSTVDITSKINGALGFQTDIWTDNGADWGTWFQTKPEFNFKPPIEGSNINVAYIFEILQLKGVDTTKSATTTKIDDAAGMFGSSMVYPSSVFGDSTPSYSGMYSSSIFGPSYTNPEPEVIDRFDYLNQFESVWSQSFKPKYAPKLYAGYGIIVDKESTKDKEDLIPSHLIKSGIKQPLWTNAAFKTDWKFWVYNYDSAMVTADIDTQWQDYKQGFKNRVDFGISQTINDYLSVSASYRNEYMWDNDVTKAGKWNHEASVGLSATF